MEVMGLNKFVTLLAATPVQPRVAGGVLREFA